MSSPVVYLNEVALDLLEFFGIDFTKVYNDRNGIKRDQAKALTRLNALAPVKQNTYTTIHRLYKSANRQDIDWASNIENTMVGTLSSALITDIQDAQHDNEINPNNDVIMIKWLPSESEEHRITHALEYGKTMTLDQAIQKGLVVDYGCKCGFQIVAGEEVFRKKYANSPKILKAMI